MERINLGFVVGEFNADITQLMMERARAHAAFLECDVTHIVRVPGTFDTPYGAKKLMEREDVDAVVAIGAVLEGDTDHDQVVAQHAARKLMDLALEYGKPVGLGISGPGMSRAQGQARIEDYARRGVEAAVKLVRRTKELEKKNAPVMVG
ncbi:MAG: 6,7-dimethyl-8-ribityllumazine synthase [Candidatus Altiarchaeota archaeon]